MPAERLILCIIVLLLVGTGLVTVYNSTAVPGVEKFHDSYRFIRQQLMWFVVGIFGFFFAAVCDYRYLVRYGMVFLAVSVLLLALVFSPIGVERNASHRWIRVLGKEVQPSEPAKFGLLIFLVYMLSRKQRKVHMFLRSYLPMLIGVGSVLGLIILQPDLSTTILLGGTSVVLFFIGGVRIWHLIGTGLAGLPAVGYLMYKSQYQLMRVKAWLDPWEYLDSHGLQPVESMTALGIGGMTGVGPGGSIQKLLYLPYPHNDFIGAILGEELGFVGMITLLVLYTGLGITGGIIAFRIKDLAGYLLASGITVLICFQAIIHLAVVTGSIPATGINLPFVSFGGSNLVMNCIGIGILVNISRRTELQSSSKFPVRSREI